MEAVTTIKLRKSTKSSLDSLKGKSESYDAAIRKIVYLARNKNLKPELIEAYRSMGSKDLELLQDWEQASTNLDDG